MFVLGAYCIPDDPTPLPPDLFLHVRGVLGNKCAGQNNFKTEEIRKIM